MLAKHVRQKLEIIVRFMMAGEGSFKRRLQDAYRTPQLGLRSIPINHIPGPIREDFDKLMKRINENEKKRLTNKVKQELMDELFFLYKKVDDYIKDKEN